MSVPSLVTQTIAIRLVDGRNGRPMVGKTPYVNFWMGTQCVAALPISTNKEGIATVTVTDDAWRVNAFCNANFPEHPVLKYDDRFRLQVPYVLCLDPHKQMYSWLGVSEFSTQDVLRHGYVSLNNCGKTTATPKPGELVLFVRPLTFWEMMRE